MILHVNNVAKVHNKNETTKQIQRKETNGSHIKPFQPVIWFCCYLILFHYLQKVVFLLKMVFYTRIPMSIFHFFCHSINHNGYDISINIVIISNAGKFIGYYLHETGIITTFAKHANRGNE